MPLSLFRQARWSALEPSFTSSTTWFSLWDAMFKLLEAMSKVSPAQHHITCFFHYKNFAGVETSEPEDIPDNAWQPMVFTSTFNLTISWYTAFLSFAQMLSCNFCASEWIGWLSVIRGINIFSEYCNIKLQSSNTSRIRLPLNAKSFVHVWQLTQILLVISHL